MHSTQATSLRVLFNYVVAPTGRRRSPMSHPRLSLSLVLSHVRDAPYPLCPALPAAASILVLSRLPHHEPVGCDPTRSHRRLSPLIGPGGIAAQLPARADTQFPQLPSLHLTFETFHHDHTPDRGWRWLQRPSSSIIAPVAHFQLVRPPSAYFNCEYLMYPSCSTPADPPREIRPDEQAIANSVALMIQQTATFKWLEQAKVNDEVQQRHSERLQERGGSHAS